MHAAEGKQPHISRSCTGEDCRSTARHFG